MWQYVKGTNNGVVVRTNPDGTMESCLVTRQDVQDWINAGNTPLLERK